MDVEPMSGIVVRSSTKYQLNMHISKIDGVPDSAEMPTVFMPVFWSDMYSIVDEKTNEFLGSSVHMVKTAEMVLDYGGLALGWILLVGAAGIQLRGQLAARHLDLDNTAAAAAGPLGLMWLGAVMAIAVVVTATRIACGTPGVGWTCDVVATASTRVAL